MTITREQVADLQPGDVVEVVNDRYPGVTMRGPLRTDSQSPRRLLLGATVIRCDDGSPLYRDWGLTVLSRAPRPLYVNHDRTEAVRGDVVKDADGGSQVWMCDEWRDWWSPTDGTVRMWESPLLPKRLRLLVDGTTGRCVP